VEKRCIVTIHVDLSSVSNATTQVGTTKERVVPGRRRKRVAEHRALSNNIQATSEPLEEYLKTPVALQCKYTVEPERFNPQWLIAGICVWLFLMPTEPALIPQLPAIICDAQL
jgi:hypothetical protein